MLEVVVIGAGQAGLSAAYYLARQGLAPGVDFIVLDANPAPGGAWLHRWSSLTLGAAHAVHDLPGMKLPPADPTEPASAVVGRYYGSYEKTFDLPIRRPVKVRAVRPLARHLPGDDAGVPADTSGQPLVVETDQGDFTTHMVINATGTWDKPHWPHYPGVETFTGRQVHTHDFRAVEEFAGQRVLVVGGGTSAVQFLLQLAQAGVETAWSTRRPPEFTTREFNPDWGRDVEARVNERTAAGLPPLSVVGVTGLPLTQQYQNGIDAGTLVSRGPLLRLTADGAVFEDGSSFAADSILWATGFRAAMDHLAPLKLREPGGGIIMDGVKVAREPRLILVGYGASASTLGANRAGRAAALAALERLSVPVGV
ncbi:Predicted flavoprotein CzcO associated with the cation diffusion facilitator CzcD [Arthrobacter alpinus]|uniref:Predicted flavoprotein CzcO associated with the cation diffusion facilitator CzcD n=1 Tax=Arthrobacter alpinus TaxID=656366 RepID=A0A1H5DQR7_9MICC|nr:FAD-dependent oxidoreductase [Arthrobacter alpinus]SED81116.1 Predicted flavoprotein CzcO associated with the cation diffusion facilitator CzcD [Arthrobacter alpinus]